MPRRSAMSNSPRMQAIYLALGLAMLRSAAMAPQAVAAFSTALAVRGKSLAAFDGRCIPGGCVAPPSNTPNIIDRPPSFAAYARGRELRRDLAEALAEAGRALPAGRLARLGATPDFRHGLLVQDVGAARGSAESYSETGWQLLNTGELEAAAAAFRRAVQLNADLAAGQDRSLNYYCPVDSRWSNRYRHNAARDRKSTRLNSSHLAVSRMPSSA